MKSSMRGEDLPPRALVELPTLEKAGRQWGKFRAMHLIETAFQDLRYALHQLRRNPSFAAVAVLTLALGIGVNTAVFGVVYGVLLRPLPYPSPSQLVSLNESEVPGGYEPVSYLDFRDWQRGNSSFTQLGAIVGDDLILTGPEGTEYLPTDEISANFFSVLGVKLALGRQFVAEEDQQGGRPVAIISQRFWEKHFSRSPQALGKVLTLNGKSYTVVGILPANFRFFRDADAYIPMGQADSTWIQDRKIRNGIEVIGRLKSGVTLQQARADMTLLQQSIEKAYPNSDKGVGVVLAPLKQDFIGNVARTLMLLMAAVVFVLLIACANVANLTLARSTARGREFAIRSALGASRPQLVGQVLVESILLGLIGGVLGLVIAQWGTHAVLAAVPGGVPRSEGVRVEPHVLGFAFVISIITGILFGLAPSLISTRANLQERLKEGGRSTEAGPLHTQSALVMSEVALTLILLVAAGLMLQTIRQLWATKLGFNPHDVFTVRVALVPQPTPSAENIRLDFRRLVSQVEAVPGVQAAGVTNMVPLSNTSSEIGFWMGPPAVSPPESNSVHRALLFVVSRGYLPSLEIPILRGRSIAAEDGPISPHVVLVDDFLAREFFPGVNPIGKQINLEFLGSAEIVGIVGHVKHRGFAADSGTSAGSEIYFPLEQVPDRLMSMTVGGMALVVRAQSNLPTSIEGVRRTLNGPGEDQAIFDFQTMEQLTDASTASTQFLLVMLGVFAALAFLLTSVGIYGVVSYSISQRTHEIGIRLALGAQREGILKLVVGHGFKLCLIGLAFGIGGALALSRFLVSLLYGVEPADPLTLVVSSLILTCVALLASYFPARRAMRLDPTTALRHE